MKAALGSTILISGLVDKGTPAKMPKYPKMPKNENDSPIREEEIENERIIAIAKMNYWTKMNNKKERKKTNE